MKAVFRIISLKILKNKLFSSPISSPFFVSYISDAKKIKNGDLGNILIKNNITDPKTGNPFYVNINNKVLVRGSTSTLNRTQLTELLREKYKPGFVYK